MNGLRVLVVEDDRSLRHSLQVTLRLEGYQPIVVADARSALQAMREDGPQAVLLDLGLPDLGGLDVLSQLRAFSSVPVLVVSARHDSADKVQALDLGADDYVTKPFGADELLARLRAAVRRAAPHQLVETGSFSVDIEAGQVSRDGEVVHLTPIEWKLLVALATRAGALVTGPTLLAEVWGPSYGTETNYLRTYVGNLRHKLEPEPSRPRHFITEPGLGYRFVP